MEKEVVHNMMAKQDLGEEMRRLEQEIAAFGRGQSLKDAAMEDVKKASDEVEKEMIHDMMAESEVKGHRKDEIVADAERAADEAEKEAVHIMMADDNHDKPEKKIVSKLAGLINYSDEDDDDDEGDGYAAEETKFSITTEGDIDKPSDPVTQVKKSKQLFRKVEIEEMSDEDL